MVVEPSGAAAVAAILDDPAAFRTPSVAVLSGGNIDPLLLGKVIQHGMASAGRVLYRRVVISDLPGGLAGLLADVGAAGASVIDVAHERISPNLHLNEVEVSLQLETRSADRGEGGGDAGGEGLPRRRVRCLSSCRAWRRPPSA
jgi:threonine dehydratase